jgi:hypothetical protein
MRLFDLLGRSRSRHAPRPRPNRVRCTVEMLEPRLALSATTSTSPPVLPPPQPPPSPPGVTPPNGGAGSGNGWPG